MNTKAIESWKTIDAETKANMFAAMASTMADSACMRAAYAAGVRGHGDSTVEDLHASIRGLEDLVNIAVKTMIDGMDSVATMPESIYQKAIDHLADKVTKYRESYKQYHATNDTTSYDFERVERYLNEYVGGLDLLSALTGMGISEIEDDVAKVNEGR